MQVVPYTNDWFEAWNTFVKQSANATFLLNRNYMDYHKDRFEDDSVLVLDDKENPLALFPANKASDGSIWSHQGLTYGGLILTPEAKTIDVLSCFARILEYYHKQGISKIIYKSIPEYLHQTPSMAEQYVMFKVQASLFRMDVSLVVDLTRPVKLQQRKHRQAKRAKSTGISMVRADDFQAFWNQVLTPNLNSRYGVNPVHSLDEITRLVKAFPNQIVQYNAVLNGEVVGGATIYDFGHTVHAQYISASAIGKQYGALDLLFRQLLEETYSNRHYLSLGIVNEDDGQTINPGLLEWKEGFGARPIPHRFYEIDPGKYNLLYVT